MKAWTGPAPSTPRRELRAKEGFPLYPLAFAVFPVVSTIAANLSYAPASQAWRPLAATLAGVVVLLLVTTLIFRSAARGAAVTGIFSVAFFGFAWYTDHPLPLPGSPFVQWSILTLLAVAVVVWRTPKLRSLNVFAGCLCLVALANLGMCIVRERSLSAHPASAAPDAPPLVSALTPGAKPDVFYIILDAHGRADALKRTMGYDESGFIDGLKQRGFYVADHSHSNYPQTELSIPSSMNMDYIGHLIPNLEEDDEDRSFLPGLLNPSAVERHFQAHGYKFFAVTSGFAPIRFPDADVRLDNDQGMTLMERALFDMTPLAAPELFDTMPLDTQKAQYHPPKSKDNVDAEVRRQITLHAFSDLRSLAKPIAEPRFVVAHILAPHTPFVFGPNGERVNIGRYHGADDYEKFYHHVGTRADYRKGYTGQVAYIDKLVLQAIDTILKAAGPHGRPIIIVQGDHGSRMNTAFFSSGHTDVTECFQNLAAFLVPDDIRKKLWRDITPVNEFRVVLNGMFGEKLPILDEHSYYISIPHPYQYIDATPYVQRTVPTSEYGAKLDYTIPPSEDDSKATAEAQSR